jgi:hypothetical protein
MSDRIGGEAIVALIFFAVVLVFVTLGCVLLAHFWLRRIGGTPRALLSSGISILIFLVPMAAVEGTGESWFVLPVVAVMLAILAFPTAFLATRKLDREIRNKEDVAAVFD